MQHRLNISELEAQVGKFAPAMGEALNRCVHCGFCLADCPTYRVTGEEAESPRGRILLMKEALEGSLEVEDAARHVDPCLGCLACVTSCPSGVEYGELMVPFRAWSDARRPAKRLLALRRRALLSTLTSPARMRWALRLGRLARPLRKALPEFVASPLDLIPSESQGSRATRARAPIAVRGERRARVVLLQGCAQSVLDPAINESTQRVFARNGIEVLEPANLGCCGALEQHVGELDAARRRATPLVRAVAKLLESGEADAFVTTTAGCGSGVREYPLLFGGTKLEAQAERVAAASVDCTTFLADLGLIEEGLRLEPGRRVAVHDACHLAHAQRETAAPRALLRSVEGVTLVEAADSELCCGSAGIYNLEQPEMAAKLGQMKSSRLAETGADWIASGNIGCLTQIRHHLERPISADDRAELLPVAGSQRASAAKLEVFHTMQILDRAAASAG